MKTECNIFHACNVYLTVDGLIHVFWNILQKSFLATIKLIQHVNITAQCSHNDNGDKITVVSRYILVQYITALCRAGKNR